MRHSRGSGAPHWSGDESGHRGGGEKWRSHSSRLPRAGRSPFGVCTEVKRILQGPIILSRAYFRTLDEVESDLARVAALTNRSGFRALIAAFTLRDTILEELKQSNEKLRWTMSLFQVRMIRPDPASLTDLRLNR